MADWNKNNRACTTLWSTLYSLNQLTSNFKDSGDMKISHLTFFNPTSSADHRKQEAQLIADQLDNVFRNQRGAQFEENVDLTEAVSSLVEILIDGDKQVKDLASVADDKYDFWGEE